MDFIRDHLGPAFSAAGLKTRIWSYDHNLNERAGGDDPGIDYPTVVMTDAQAAKHVGGIAFHGYEGNPVRQVVLIPANTEAKEAKIRVEFGGSAFVTALPRQSAETYTWAR